MMSWRSLYFCSVDWTLARDVVVLLADDVRIEQRRRRVERIDGRVDAELGEVAAESTVVRVEVGERRRGRRVGEVVGGDVDGLDAVIEPLFVEVMRSWSAPISVESVGW